MTTLRALTGLALFALALRATAAEPTVRDVNVRGLQTNGTTTLTVTGDDLGKAPKLLLPFAAKQTLKTGNTDKKADFEVELKDATPGLHHLRVVTEGGVSLPVVSLGAQGAVVCWEGRTLFASVAVEAVNPVGSGDCLVGGMAVALARGASAEEALRLGVACGAANALTAETGVVRREDMEALLSRVTTAEVE